jgi:uncharacterized protein
MPTLRRITVFPIKALDGCEVEHVNVLASGALQNDRRWAIVDAQGRYVNGKRTPAVHALRATYEETLSKVRLSISGVAATFQLPDESALIAAWLSEALDLKCRLIENADGGFPDDGDAPGPTIISTASLEAAASWFEGVETAEMRRRIRANLEIDAHLPFWEDRLADDGGAPRRFSMAGVVYRGRTICKRCIVPTRDSQSGAVMPGFAQMFVERRQAELPTWSPPEQFDHYYRLAINTSAEWVGSGAVLHVGDELTLQEPSVRA